VVFNGQPQVFYWDQISFSLRHAWWNGAFWSAETLDGNGANLTGHGQTLADVVGGFTSTVVFNGQPQVFYFNFTKSSLRHSWWNGAFWSAETLDGKP
jgi:hypothetical protein